MFGQFFSMSTMLRQGRHTSDGTTGTSLPRVPPDDQLRRPGVGLVARVVQGIGEPSQRVARIGPVTLPTRAGESAARTTYARRPSAVSNGCPLTTRGIIPQLSH
jgi:hypothetical protein